MNDITERKKIKRDRLCGGTGHCATCNARTVCRSNSKIDLQKGKIQLPEDVLWSDEFFNKAGRGGPLGVAFDIGSTTMAAMLWDLSRKDRTPLAACSTKNPLTSFGPDVISRIEYAGGDRKRIGEMQYLLVEQMNRMIGEMTTEAVGRISAVGNPTMMHFLFGKDPSGLAIAPFRGEELPLEINAEELGLGQDCAWKLMEGTMLRTLPVMGGHLGADAAAVMLALRLPEKKQPVIAIDIGTNGELILTDGRGQLWGCSTAAGPAFEGGSITPGSKFIDTAATMLVQGWMDEEGTVGGHALLTQNDIRLLQTAKGAVAAGIEILTEAAGLKTTEHICLAGTFGNHIRPESAVRIGLLPKNTEITGCGNAAGAGASMILLSDEEWDRGCCWAKQVRHVELADQPHFTEAFLRNMYFR
ncbi:MAG: DUF4445 domain-containing protein [Firmicutes bacterium]|nr:DUF4445 domain-containing protein [Bacillota bacterium]